MRRAGEHRGLRSAPRGLGVVALAAALFGACAPENPHPPDALLVDSLGLSPYHRVHRVAISANAGAESARPSEVVLGPGAFVEFHTTDRQVHTVSFLTDSMEAAQAAFLLGSRQDRSPPMVELDARFVVSFEAAPPGRYPYLVEGNARAATGVIEVGAPPP